MGSHLPNNGGFRRTREGVARDPHGKLATPSRVALKYNHNGLVPNTTPEPQIGQIVRELKHHLSIAATVWLHTLRLLRCNNLLDAGSTICYTERSTLRGWMYPCIRMELSSPTAHSVRVFHGGVPEQTGGTG